MDNSSDIPGMLLGIFIIILLFTYFILIIRKRFICNKQYQPIIAAIESTVVEIRYLDPTADGQGFTNDYYARFYLTPSALIVIPDMSYMLSPDIFLFVHVDTHAKGLPKPIYLCEMSDLRMTKHSIILTSKAKWFPGKKSRFEMVLELPEDPNSMKDIIQFLERNKS